MKRLPSERKLSPVSHRGVSRLRSRSAALVIAAAALACLAFPPVGLSSQRSGHRRAGSNQEIYFFSNPSSPVSGPHLAIHNRLVIRPSGFPLFEDGQWVLEKLHWTGWGSPVAKAKGLSSSSNDDPNAAQGKRIITWAKVRLSEPGHLHGHRVYRCIRVTVPPPANYPPGCLQRSHHYVGLLKPGSGEPVGEEDGRGGPRHITNFLSPDHKVWCLFSDSVSGISCGTEPSPPTHSATMNDRGRVEICSVLQTEFVPGARVPKGCFQNWPLPADHVPTLGYGEQTTFDAFRCDSEPDGITCTKASGQGKGHGFRVNKDEAVEDGT
jgi:hypothetical protein